MRPTSPAFEFSDTYPATVPIGSTSIEVKVKRFTKTEREAYEQAFQSHFEARGTIAPATNVSDLVAFAEQSLRDYITLDEGWLKDRGEWVTTGEGVIAMFNARPDILAEFLAAILFANRLSDIARKNLRSPRAFEAGSTASTPTRGEPVTGVGPAPIAAPAVGSDSASDGDATASNSPDALSGQLLEVH